jgi:myo-inositol 2-dehydrogenase / D-chiro-inositol 1-dehydrogenase
MAPSRNQDTVAPSAHCGLSRRNFLAGAGAAAVGITVIQPQWVRAARANETISLGVIGCGGRGTWIAKLFQEHGGYHVAAGADYFEDRVTSFGEALQIKEDARFAGLHGYRRMLDMKLDAIVIESPPYFHPEQAAEAVQAGKHVFLAKPIAVDVPGCTTVEESGRKATENSLCFLVDFQTRSDPFYMEAIKRVHEGAIGPFAFGESIYHADIPWMGQMEYAKDAPNNVESRLRSWGLDRVLSGDIITEQNVHTLDVASWIMNQPPLRAFGTGGRKVRQVGDCWDTFTVTFEYPDNVGIAFSSRQFNGHGTTPEGILNRMFGTLGVLETSYGGPTMIKGENFYRGGSSPAIYQEGAVANIATFHRDILAGNCQNSTVPESVRSNLVTILGRTAAYRGEVVTWDQMLADNEKLELDLTGLRS